MDTSSLPAEARAQPRPRSGARFEARARPLVPFLLAAGLVVVWSSGLVGAELGTRHAPAGAWWRPSPSSAG